ncbi:MAG TPA: molybdopterin-dependent oxidoreductase [Terriglobales bacterium]|nr:molybdopterin-dependent oxidoreductase [Terriglobales bacterium]
MTRDIQAGFSRRDWLRMSLIAGAAVVTGFNRSWWLPVAFAETQDAFHGGKKIGDVDFVGEIPVEMNAVIGTELDGRLYTDLSTLAPDHPITPTKDFYIRTCVSKLLGDDTRGWTIRLAGLARERANLSLARLTAMEKPLGVHVMECVGNQRGCHFGLVSAASWTGVALSEILNTVHIGPRASHVLVSGFDRYQAESVSSIPGASWIFKLEELRARGAFLATRMNGELLPRDHGAPVRLVVPGWYGCACIKWVNEIALVPDDAPATSQMKEYAERTGQQGIPDLARDYLPAAMEYAATPIRIERWSVDGGFKYRVVGLLWGGSAPVKKLEIRFNPDEEYVSVDHVDTPGQNSWRFWTHTWSPRSEGTYLIRLRVKDPIVQAKRLESGRYERAVVI